MTVTFTLVVSDEMYMLMDMKYLLLSLKRKNILKRMGSVNAQTAMPLPTHVHVCRNVKYTLLVYGH